MHFARALPGKTRAKILIERVAGASIAFAAVAGGPAAAQTAYETCGSTAGAQCLSCFRKHGDPGTFYSGACNQVAYESGTRGLKNPINAHISRMISICGGNPDKATCETTAEILASDKQPKNILVCNCGG